MSLASMLWALKKAPHQNSGEHVVLIAMADYTGDDGCWCFASKDAIAEDLNLTPRSVQKHWAELSRRGLIARDDHCDHPAFLAIPERYRPAAWRLNLDVVRGEEVAPLDEGAGEQSGSPLRGEAQYRRGEKPASPKPSTRTKNRTTRSSTARSNPRETSGGDYGSPARTIGAPPGGGDGTVRRRSRGIPGPDTAAGLADYFGAAARESPSLRDVLDPDDTSVAPLAANIARWLRSGVTADEVRSDIDEFLASREARRGDTPLWRRFTTHAYRMRQHRRPAPETDHERGLEFTERSIFD